MPTKKADISCFYKILIFSLFRERVDAKCSLGTRIEMVAFLFFFKVTFYIPEIMNLINQQWTGKATIAGIRFALVRSLYSKVIYFLLTESMSWDWIELSVGISVRKMYAFISDFFNYITSGFNLDDLNGSLIASVL